MEQIVPIIDINGNGIVKTIHQLMHPKLIKCIVWECDIKNHKINLAHR